MKYTYRFDNGETVEINVEESWNEILKNSDTEIGSKNRHQERHTCSLDGMNFEGQAFAYTDTGFEEIFGVSDEELARTQRSREILRTYQSLSASQKELFQAVFIRKERVIDIAEKEGVSQPAISGRIERIRKKFEKFLR